MAQSKAPLLHLATRDEESGALNAIVETPKGSRNKFSYDEGSGLFLLKRVLPAGHYFPYDFGFLPSTQGGDGDPLDVLALMEEPAFPGALVRVRLLGAIEAEQTEEGSTKRNDRLIAVAVKSPNHSEIEDLAHLSANLVEEIEHFFISYNRIRGKEFKPLRRVGPARADEIVAEGEAAFKKARKKR